MFKTLLHVPLHTAGVLPLSSALLSMSSEDGALRSRYLFPFRSAFSLTFTPQPL